MVLFFSLPAILENQITKKASQTLELKDFQISLKKLGLFNTIAGKITTGETLEIDSVNIDYSLKSLMNKKIEKIQVSGLTIKVNIDENYNVIFNDFDLKKFERSDSSLENNNNNDISSLPFLPEKIELKNSRIVLNILSQQIIIPFEISSVIKKEENIITAYAVLRPFGEKIKAVISLDLKKGINNIKIDSKSFDLYHLAQLLKVLAPEATIPFNTRINIKTDITINKEKLKAQGMFAVDQTIIAPLKIKYDLNLDIKNNNSFTFEAINSDTKTIKLSYNSQDIILAKPYFKLTLKGNPLKAAGKVLVKAEKTETIFEDNKTYAKSLSMDSDFYYDFGQTGKGLSIATNAGLKQISIESELLKASFQSAGASGRILLDKNLSPIVKIRTHINKGRFESSEHKIKISGINANIPFSLPYSANRPSDSGKFTINKCIYDDNYELKVHGALTQVESGILFNGNVAFPEIKDFKLEFNSKAVALSQNNININLDFHSRPFKFSSKNLSKFTPKQVKGINFDLNLSSNGKIEYSSKGIKSNLKIDIRNGNVDIPESKLTLQGIATSLEFKNLLTFQSKPAQVLAIDAIQLNDIIMNNAIIKYNIESSNSLLVESTQLKWCNGTVSSEAIRVPNKANNYSIILYCDRLELTGILKQMGAFRAEGNGTLSGRIPVTYANGEIAFNNGFLFSTPGQGGKIMIDKADKLTAGIPMDTPQFSELDLAKEALKNYDYEWAKLIFNTFEDTLLVNMQFDGKPSNQVLPFEYKKELGRFVRVDAASRGSHFQGIKLDVNLKLPFNQVMKFGTNLKKAFK
ncbi:MAG: YdbH domain-containing protein [Desulfobacteraceae bacterium]|nr:YdbH domain-containing protein [Desulfobacteraceae bacterium]